MHDLFLCLQSKMCNLYSFRKRINVLFIFVIRFYRCTYFAMNVIQMVQIADILGFMRSSFSCGRPLNSLEMIENITKNNQAAKSYRAYVMCLWWKGQVELNTKHFSILNLLLNTLGLYWNLTSFCNFYTHLDWNIINMYDMCNLPSSFLIPFQIR